MLTTSCSTCHEQTPDLLASKREPSEPAAGARLRRPRAVGPARLCPTVDIVGHRLVHCVMLCFVAVSDVSTIVERAFYPSPSKIPAVRGAAVRAARNCSSRKSKEAKCR